MSGYTHDNNLQLNQKQKQLEAKPKKIRKEDLDLLENLKNSPNITQELAALSQERPYTYAKVMNYMAPVIGSSQARKIHDTVAEKRNAFKQRLLRKEDTALRKADVAKSETSADDAKPEKKDVLITFNTPWGTINLDKIEVTGEETVSAQISGKQGPLDFSGTVNVNKDGVASIGNITAGMAISGASISGHVQVQARPSGNSIQLTNATVQITANPAGLSSLNSTLSLEGTSFKGTASASKLADNFDAEGNLNIEIDGTTFKIVESQINVRKADLGGGVALSGNATLTSSGETATGSGEFKVSGVKLMQVNEISGSFNFTGANLTVEVNPGTKATITGDGVALDATLNEMTITNNSFTANVGLDFKMEGERITSNSSTAVSINNNNIEVSDLEITATVNEDIEVGSFAKIKSGSTGSVTVSNIESESPSIDALKGNIEAVVLKNGQDFINASGSGEIDLKETFNVKTFSADGSLVGEHAIGSNINITSGTGKVSIKDNKVEDIHANLDFDVLKGGAPIIKANGETELGLEGELSIKKLTAKANLINEQSITDNIKLTSFNGTLTITNNEVDNVNGSLGLTVQKDGKDFIKAEGSTELNLKDDFSIKSLSASASLAGEQKIGEKINITSLTGSVTITENKIESLTGTLGIALDSIPNLNMSGDVSFSWSEQDSFSYDGQVNVEALNGKVSGSVNIKGKGEEKPEIDGEVEFKIKEWLSGKLKFQLEDDWVPALSGSMTVNTTLVEARDLISVGKEISKDIPVWGPIMLNVGAGVGFKVSMEPVTLSATIAVTTPFRLDAANDKAVPDFEADIEANAGIKLVGEAGPHVGVSVGLPGINAGIRLKAMASLQATASGGIGGKVKGGQDGVKGELGIGLNASVTASLSASPEVFATAGPKEWSHKLTTWTMDLGELFKFNWQKTFKFGDEKGEAGGSSHVATHSGNSNSTAAEMPKGAAEKFNNPQGGGQTVEDGPEVSDPSQILGESGASPETAIFNSLEEKFGKPLELLKKAAQIAEKVKKIWDMVCGIDLGSGKLAFLGEVLYIAYRAFIKKDIDGPALKAEIQELMNLVNSFGSLFADMIPKKIKDFFEGLKKTASDVINKLKEGINYFVNEIVPGWAKRFVGAIVDKLKSIGEGLIDLFKKWENGTLGWRDIAGFVWDIVSPW